MATVQPYQQIDLSGAVQTATSRFLRKKNELASSKNAAFNKKIGSAVRRDGYEQVGRTIQHGNDSLGLHVYRYSDNNKILVGINSADNSAANVQYLDGDNYWPTIAQAAPGTRLSFINLLNECYITGYAPDTNTYMPMVCVDSTLAASSTRNVYKAPRARFIDEFQNGIIAMNCEVDGKKYKDRFYVSSPAIGAITFIQNDQSGLIQQLRVNSVRYLKPGMSVDIYSAGTNAKVVDSLSIISVDKNNNLITFSPQTLSLKDNDEIWVAGRKGQLNVLWNTDYPTPESADWKRIPPGVDGNNEITAHGRNNNRKLIFTRNSTWKFDGANLVNISDTVGCVAPNTVKNIGGWTIWLHDTGVWAYNDSVGQIKLLSRSITNYIKSINLANISLASAGVVGRVYKLSVGEIASFEASTTSTSTSSTSTSSTSSSTSSTSTSSTSTSTTVPPTSTSTSSTSSSTSSTSSSTSSTSTSSTSTSYSTSSTSQSTSTSSTTTTTVASTKQVVRLVYDFDSNTWWPEYHKREIRYQINHTMSGYLKPYFTDETGRLFRDETGNLDHFDTIPFEVELGRNNLGFPLKKNFVGCVAQTEKARSTLVLISIDGGNWKDIGQITEDAQEFKMTGISGKDINYKFSHNNTGDGPVIDGVVTFSSAEETKV